MELYRARGLDTVLSTGYGEFTCAGIVHNGGKDQLYRGLFHIEADILRYSWEKSEDGSTFSKTGDWTLTREPTAAISTFQP